MLIIKAQKKIGQTTMVSLISQAIPFCLVYHLFIKVLGMILCVTLYSQIAFSEGECEKGYTKLPDGDCAIVGGELNSCRDVLRVQKDLMYKKINQCKINIASLPEKTPIADSQVIEMQLSDLLDKKFPEEEGLVDQASELESCSNQLADCMLHKDIPDSNQCDTNSQIIIQLLNDDVDLLESFFVKPYCEQGLHSAQELENLIKEAIIVCNDQLNNCRIP